MALRRTLALALAGLVAPTACTSEPPRKAQSKVDHTTNGTAAQPASAAGPPAKALQANWRIDVPGVKKSEGDVGFALAAGQVLLTTQAGVSAYDGRSGSERWHYRELGWRMVGYALTGNEASPALVVFTQQRNLMHAVGIEAATGRLLWKLSPTWRPVINAKNRRAVAGAGMIMVVDQTAEGATMSGIDAQTGLLRWTQRRLEYCDPNSLQGIADSDGSLFVVPEGCFHTVNEVHAFDPATGAVRWRRRPPVEFTDAMVRGGVTLLNSQALRAPASALIGPTGQRLEAPIPACSYSVGCFFTAQGGRVFLSTAKGAGRPQVAAIDTRGAAAKKGAAKKGTVKVPVKKLVLPGGAAEDHVAMAGSGGQLYGLRKKLAAKLLPAELDVVDTKSLSVRRVAMPFSFQDAGVGEFTDVGQIVAADGLLYVLADIRDRVRLTAYAPSGDRGPAVLGGTLVKDWPDACKLFAGLTGLRSRPVNQLGFGQVELGRWGCRFNWRDKQKTGVIVVGWVAATDKQAVDLMKVDPTQAHLLANVADQAYTFTNNDTGGPDLVMRVGRLIVASYGIREQEKDLQELARTVVNNMPRLP